MNAACRTIVVDARQSNADHVRRSIVADACRSIAGHAGRSAANHARRRRRDARWRHEGARALAIGCALVALTCLGLVDAHAASYRCDVDGRVLYSDKPCTTGKQSTVATEDPVDATTRAAALERKREDQAALAQYARDHQRERQQDLQAAALARKRHSDIVKDAQGCKTLARKARDAHDAFDIAGPRDQPKARLKMQRADDDYAALCKAPHG